jgi:prevent-host-death family protein
VKIVNVYEARGQFSRLLDEAEAGEEIVIARNGKPIVRLVPIQPPERRFGRWQGQVPTVSGAEWAAADDLIGDVFSETAP